MDEDMAVQIMRQVMSAIAYVSSEGSYTHHPPPSGPFL